jgi:hypothetical protein
LDQSGDASFASASNCAEESKNLPSRHPAQNPAGCRPKFRRLLAPAALESAMIPTFPKTETACFDESW